MKRSVAAAVGLIAICAILIPLYADLANIAAIAGVPLGTYWAMAGGAWVMALAALTRPRRRHAAKTTDSQSLTDADAGGGHSTGEPVVVATLVSAAALVSVPLASGLMSEIYVTGFDAAAVTLGLVGGGLLAVALSRHSASSTAGRRFDDPAYDLFQSNAFQPLRVGLAVLLFAALMTAAHDVARLGVSPLLLSDAGVGALGMALLAALALGTAAVARREATAVTADMSMRTSSAVSDRVIAAVFACSILALIAIAVAANAAPDIPGGFPIAIGDLVSRLSQVEQQALLSGVADPVTFKAHLRPLVVFDAWNFAAVVASVTLGVAAFATLNRTAHIARASDAQPDLQARTGTDAAAPIAGATVLVAVVVVVVAALALAAKFAVLRDLAGQPPASLPVWASDAVTSGALKVCGVAGVSDALAVELAGRCANANGVAPIVTVADIAWQPAAVWLRVAPLLGLANGMSIVASGLALIALLGCLAAAAAVVTKRLTGPLTTTTLHSPSTPRLNLAFVLLSAAVIAHVVDLSAFAFWMAAINVCAAAVMPALLLRWMLPRARVIAVAIPISIGAAMTLVYAIWAQAFAVSFVTTFAHWSNTADYAVQDFAELQAIARTAEGVTRDAANVALAATAREMANIWGVHPYAAMCFGGPIGFVLGLVASLVFNEPTAKRTPSMER